MELQVRQRAQNKKNTNEVNLYEGGAHFSYDEMYKRLEKISRTLNQTNVKPANNKNSFQGVGIAYNNGKNKNLIKPGAIIGKNLGKSHQFEIEIKSLNKGKELKFSKEILMQGKKANAGGDAKVVLPMINTNSNNAINTAVSTRDSLKVSNLGIRNSALKNSMNFKDLVNFYTSSTDSLQNLCNSDRKVKASQNLIKIKVFFFSDIFI
jgi:hypothetical protein